MKLPSIKVGNTYTDLNGLVCTVSEYISAKKIKLVYEDGYEQYRSAGRIRKGFVKGTKRDRKITPESKTKTMLKNKHDAIMRRLFRDKHKVKNFSYSDSDINIVWKDFDNFYSWALNQVGHSHSDWHIDKDILRKGNKEYGPETCCFIPLRINILFTSRASKRGDYPIGVYKNSKSGKFVASCRDGVSKVRLGSFDAVEDAFNAYKVFKEALIKSVAEEYKSVIDTNVYQALLSYEVEITD